LPLGHPWSAREAARGTISGNIYLSPLILHNNGVCYEFRDAATLGFNNPTDLARREAEKIWPDGRIGVVLSLGAGLSGLAPSKPVRGWAPTASFVKPIIDEILSKLSSASPIADTTRKRAMAIVNKLVSTAVDTQVVNFNAAPKPPQK
jgi:hypothetical protein